MEPKLSIVVPVYNVEKYIRICVDSLLKQSYTSFELILVDDGSPDNCPMICDEYSENDARVKVIHQKNAGVSMARNAGIDAARGRWIYFVDSDDWLVDDKLGKLVQFAERSKADIVFADAYEQYENGQSKRLHLFSRRFVSDNHELIMNVQKSILCHKYSPYYALGADSAYPAPWSKLIRTSLIKENNIRFDPSVGGVYDDGLFTLEILEAAQKISYSGIAVYNYRILNSSIVHAYRQGMVEKFEKNCEKVEEFGKRNRKDKAFFDAEYARRIAYLSSFLTAFFFSDENPGTNAEIKRELMRTLEKSVWKTAIDNVNWKNLEKKHIYTLACMRTKCIPGLKLYSILKKKVKNR